MHYLGWQCTAFTETVHAALIPELTASDHSFFTSHVLYASVNEQLCRSGGIHTHHLHIQWKTHLCLFVRFCFLLNSNLTFTEITDKEIQIPIEYL